MMRVQYGTNKRGTNQRDLSSRFVVLVLENTRFQCRRKLRNKYSFDTSKVDIVCAVEHAGEFDGSKNGDRGSMVHGEVKQVTRRYEQKTLGLWRGSRKFTQCQEEAMGRSQELQNTPSLALY
jgi:hypothetical protein